MERYITDLLDTTASALTKIPPVSPRFVAALLLGTSLGVGVWAMYAFGKRTYSFYRGWKMKGKDKAERTAKLRDTLGEVYTSALEDAVDAGKITEEDARREYRKLSRTLGLWGCANGRFSPAPPNPTDLKERIKARLSLSKPKAAKQEAEEGTLGALAVALEK